MGNLQEGPGPQFSFHIVLCEHRHMLLGGRHLAFFPVKTDAEKWRATRMPEEGLATGFSLQTQSSLQDHHLLSFRIKRLKN